MSEYQYVAFRAIDAPVSEKNLEYMERQSSRAKISRWSFENEYHFGDFRGNASEMLRRGYDFHLHYANFGIRTLMIRLPFGVPDSRAAKPYLKEEGFSLEKDAKGDGVILSISPSHEPGDLDDLWDVDQFVDRLLPLRAEILNGDLRPFYLAHLAAMCDMNHDPEEATEGPVPAGLDQLTEAQSALAEFYGLDESLIAAAAQGCPPLATREQTEDQHIPWLKLQSASKKDAWLARWMANADTKVRIEILTEYRESQGKNTWPTVVLNRTVAVLEKAAKKIHEEEARKAKEKDAKDRARRLAKMAEDPTVTLSETEKLVKERSVASYEKIAGLLADLREALAGSDQPDLAEKQALSLTKAHPTLRTLTSALRKKGFVKK